MAKAHNAVIAEGITIVGPSSLDLGELLDVNPSGGMARNSYGVDHQGTTGFIPKIYSTIADPGVWDCTVAFDPDQDPELFILHAKGSWVITFPIPEATPALTQGATWTFDGAVVNYAAAGPYREKMTGTISIDRSGDIVVAAAS